MPITGSSRPASADATTSARSRRGSGIRSASPTSASTGGRWIVQGWVLLNWRRDTTIESVTLAPRVSDAVFHDVTVPAGITVQVQDEAGRFVAQIQQAEDGVPSLELKPYLELLVSSERTCSTPRSKSGARRRSTP